jgi:hypothetical protein
MSSLVGFGAPALAGPMQEAVTLDAHHVHGPGCQHWPTLSAADRSSASGSLISLPDPEVGPSSPPAIGMNISATSQANPYGVRIHFDFSRIDANASLTATQKSQVKAGYIAAGNVWSSRIWDNTDVNLVVDYSALGAGVLAQAGSSFNVVSYAAIRAALAGDATSDADRSAVANLQTGANLRYLDNRVGSSTTATGSGAARADLIARGANLNDGTNGLTYDNQNLFVNTSLMKALGLAPDYTNPNRVRQAGTDVDAIITFNSGFNFDLDRSDGITAGFYDFITIAAHEIGHTLGFVSGVDRMDSASGRGGNAAFARSVNGNNPNGSSGDLMTINADFREFFGGAGTVLDLFRYSTQGLTQSALDWTTGLDDGNATIDGIRIEDILTLNATGIPRNVPFFSIDGGITREGTFSTGSSNGLRINVPACFNAAGTSGILNLGGGPCPAAFPVAGRGFLSSSQASHWIDSVLNDIALGLPIGIMDPTGAPDIFYDPTALDWLAMDAIGWNLIPEPGSLSLLGLGAAALVAVSRRRRKA